MEKHLLLLLQELHQIHLLLIQHVHKNAQAISNTPLTSLMDDWEVMQHLKISRSTLYRLKSSLAIPSVRIGKKTYYQKSDIEALRLKYMK